MKILLHFEGGERMCEPGHASRLPSHVIESGAGIYLTIAQMQPQFRDLRLTPESREGWARVRQLLGIFDSVVGPLRALVNAANTLTTFWNGGEGAKSDGHEVHLAGSDVLDLLLRSLVIAPCEKVVGVPLVCTTRMKSSWLAVLDAAIQRQRSRALAMGQAMAAAAVAAEEAAAARAAKVAEDKRLAAEKAAADHALRELRKAQETWWFAAPSVDSIEAAMAECRRKGVDDTLLEGARVQRDGLLAGEVWRKALSSSMAAYGKVAASQAAAARAAKAAEDKRLAAAKAAADRALRELRKAQEPWWFAAPSADAIDAAMGECLRKGVDDTLLEGARVQRDGLLAGEVWQKAVAEGLVAYGKVAVADAAARRQTAAEQAAAEEAAQQARVVAAKRAQDAERKAKAEREIALVRLQQAQKPPWWWFAAPSVDAIEAAISECRRKGVDDTRLEDARVQRDGLLAGEVWQKAVAEALLRVRS